MTTPILRESRIEKALVRRVKEMGGVAFKFASPSCRGVPDRLVLLPDGRILFVELKAQGHKSTPLQTYQQERIRALGFDVRVVDSLEGVDHVA